jgi:tetratricopeptide (TPR) repeat protein
VKTRGLVVAVAATAAVAAAAGAVYLSRPSLPAPGTPTYEQVSRAFYHGLAALEVGLLDDARQQFTAATGLVPEEPASWANLGLAQLRLGELEAAVAPVARALELAPDNVDVVMLAGRMEVARGRLDEAVARLRQAVSLDERGLQPRFALADELQRTGTPEADADAAALYDALVTLVPANLAVLLERARLAAKMTDATRLQDSVARVATQADGWPAVAQEQLAALQQATAAARYPDAARSTTLLRNVLARVPAFSESLAAVRTPAELIAPPLERFVALEPASARPAPADTALAFSRQPLGPPGTDVALLALDAARANQAAAAVDWNHDFRLDLARAGGAGVQLLLQGEDGALTDATAAAGVAAATIPEAIAALWPADLDMDGDIDLVIGTAGSTRVLRNNGDGTWLPLDTFAAVRGARAFAWADLDGDADPDAAFAVADGALRVLTNRQTGQFRPLESPSGLSGTTTVTAADLDADGVIDLVVGDGQGRLTRVTWRGEAWEVAPLATWAGSALTRVVAADLDNNGALDVVAARAGASRVWLASEFYALAALPADLEGEAWLASDTNGDGSLDLLGTAAGTPSRWLGNGSLGYHWKTFTTRAQQNAGDQRINSFGIGGEIEVKAGLLWQKQVIQTGVIHFGLGPRTSIDVARVVWPNGVPQAEFGIGVDDAFVAEQRLKGSCPWVFAYDGSGVNFVTDFLWRSPLGLRINAQDTAGVTQTEDWVRIRGDQLAARDGRYDVRITAELWETHFFDHVSLLVVDHPDDAEVFVDERFSAASPPRLEVQALRDRRAVARAVDHGGRDVTALVADRDGRYLATFERGRFQGIAEPHAVEIDLPAGLRAGASLVLVAEGWVYPTDSSINLAVGQGGAAKPSGLALDVQDAAGTWREVVPDLGFPAGKNKSMLIDLAPARGGRRLRLRTNLEISWDRLSVAERVDAPLRVERLATSRAELRFRGFSQTSSPRGEAPETPEYARIANTAPRWRDLVGYHTRFGEVGELLTGVDDRYVIMNAGDELRLEFPERPAPARGWRRDFVLVGDGWEKDGDYNTGFSQTVLPLPSHAQPNYGKGLPEAGAQELRLEDDPVYQAHRGDWERFHTRFVRPDGFVSGLRR